MLILLSPAKNLNFDPVSLPLPPTSPRLCKDIEELLKRTRKLSRTDLRGLMKISEPLADLNYERFQALSKGLPEEEGKTAIHAFNGDVYRGLKASTMTHSNLEWAQDHLRMLSGLYGVLRPLDLIHPYRLEMGSRLDTERGATLYDFWGNRISRLLNDDLLNGGGPILNLASKEYFGAVDRKALKAPVIEAVFKEEKDGKSRIMAFYAKYARGLMARWIIDNEISDQEQVKAFNLEGYTFDPVSSTDTSLVFSRPQPPTKN